MTMIYTPRLEIAREYEDGIYVEDAFEDWDSYPTEEEARACAEEIMQAVRNGNYWHDDNQFFAISIEVGSVKDDVYELEDIIDICERIPEPITSNK